MKKTSVKEIRERIASVDVSEYPLYIETLKKDERKAVSQLVSSMTKKHEKYLSELDRIKKMREYELMLHEKGMKIVAGVDEVGRGPLAGPVVTAAVILPEDSEILYINDSKKLTAKKREELDGIIRREAVSVSLGIIDNEGIDSMNILEATKAAMKKAVEGLDVKPDAVLIDALRINIDIPQKDFVKGDERIYSIGAASIVAKVYRDSLMKKYAEKYPGYGFERNMGYGTLEHVDAIREMGLTPIHRKTFCRNI